MQPLSAHTLTLPAIGALFEAPWGRYVYRGARPDGGRLPLLEVGGTATCVMVALDRLETDYRHIGHEERPCPAQRAQQPVTTTPPAPAPPASSGAGGGAIAPTSSKPANELPGTAPTAPSAGSSGRSVRTLGAVRPPANSVGMWPGNDLGGGRYASIPGKETLYWLPCCVYSTEAVEVPRILRDGTEEHPAVRKQVPHAFFIASSLRPTMYCTACRPSIVRAADRVQHQTPLAKSSSQVPAHPPAPDRIGAGRGVGELAHPVHDVGLGAGVVALVQPVADPLVEGTVPVAHVAPGRASTPPSDIPRDDPRDEVADFSRPPKGAPVYRPTRVDCERGEFWDERAAIFEYEGGFDRWISERMALEETMYAQQQGWIR